MKSLLPISSLCKFIKRLILFGNVIKLFSLSSNVFKAESLPKFAGRYSMYASFIYNSLNPTICVIASGKRSNGLTLISIERRFLHSFILSGNSLIPKKVNTKIMMNYLQKELCIKFLDSYYFY